MAIIHACTMAIVHACTMAMVHACTMAIGHACTMAMVHAGAVTTVHACTMTIVHACTTATKMCLSLNAAATKTRLRQRKRQHVRPVLQGGPRNAKKTQRKARQRSSGDPQNHQLGFSLPLHNGLLVQKQRNMTKASTYIPFCLSWDTAQRCKRSDFVKDFLKKGLPPEWHAQPPEKIPK